METAARRDPHERSRTSLKLDSLSSSAKWLNPSRIREPEDEPIDWTPEIAWATDLLKCIQALDLLIILNPFH